MSGPDLCAYNHVRGTRVFTSWLPILLTAKALHSSFRLPIQAIEETPTRALHDANFIKMSYPSSPFVLDDHQRCTVYHIAGRLMRSALARVKRDRKLAPAFLLFVKIHKYDTAEDFRKAHPGESYRGLEAVAEERNAKWEGKSLLFPFTSFLEFGLAVEVGCKSSLENPILVATYHGDLAPEILEMVSTAEPVKVAWARCAQHVTDDRRGGGEQGWGSASFEALFQFVMQKRHNCGMYDYTRSLTRPGENEGELKSTEQATGVRDGMLLRDQATVFGISSGGQTSSAGKAKKDVPPITEEHWVRAAELTRTI